MNATKQSAATALLTVVMNIDESPYEETRNWMQAPEKPHKAAPSNAEAIPKDCDFKSSSKRDMGTRHIVMISLQPKSSVEFPY